MKAAERNALRLRALQLREDARAATAEGKPRDARRFRVAADEIEERLASGPRLHDVASELPHDVREDD